MPKDQEECPNCHLKFNKEKLKKEPINKSSGKNTDEATRRGCEYISIFFVVMEWVICAVEFIFARSCIKKATFCLVGIFGNVFVFPLIFWFAAVSIMNARKAYVDEFGFYAVVALNILPWLLFIRFL